MNPIVDNHYLITIEYPSAGKLHMCYKTRSTLISETKIIAGALRQGVLEPEEICLVTSVKWISAFDYFFVARIAEHLQARDNNRNKNIGIHLCENGQ